jgi:hypothetical protein
MTTLKQPEISPNAEKLDKIISRISSGDIRIPAFQRGYIWKQNQILELLDSVVKNYPIGSVLLWSTMDKLKHTRNIAGYAIPESSPEYPVNYVLDGQQRLSSIYATLSAQTMQDTQSSDYNPNLDLFEIYYDFDAKAFYHKNDVASDSDYVIYLRDFLNGAKLIDAMRNLNPQFHGDVKDLYSKFINYEVPVVTIKNRSKSEVGIIFERINNTGTKLSTLDLMTAWTWTDDFHLQESIKDLLDELDEKNFGEISQNIILQAISGLIQDDTTTPAILQLSGEQVRDNWKNFCESIKKTIDFLYTDLNCAHQDFLPAQQQLTGLIKFFSIPGIPTSDQYKALKNWFWKTSFSDRYSTGKTTSKMNVDIEAIINIRKNDFTQIDNYKYTVTESELIGTIFSKGNAITRAFLLLMAQSNPIDLVKNVKIDLAVALSEYNRKEYHHIFPNAFLSGKGYAHDMIFSVANFCFLPSDSNKKISKRSPSDYFFSIIPGSEYNAILTSNLIPLRKDIYTRDDFNTFLVERAKLILIELDKLTN